MTDKKSIEQQAALDAWKKFNSIGIVQAVTGFGKSRVGVLAASEEKGSVLVVTPTTVLRDVEWPNEFKKWGVSTDNVEFACIQSLYTKTNLSYDLIIADEIHLMGGEEYIQFFNRTKFKKLLGLTATIESDSPILKLFRVVYTVTLKNALSFNAIAPFRIKNIGVELKERKRYEGLTNTIDKHFGRIANKNFSILTRLVTDSQYAKQQLHPDDLKFPFIVMGAIRKRKDLIYTDENKIQTAITLIEKLSEDKQIIAFTQTIESATTILNILRDKNISARMYHSVMKKQSKKEALDDFKNKQASVLITVKALNTGVNIPECDTAIIVNGDSTPINFIQRLGRILRVLPNKEAIVYQLYNKDTVDQMWLNKRLTSTPPQFIEYV